MKFTHVLTAVLAAASLIPGCKDDAYYGSELPGGTMTTVGFSDPQETKIVINSFEGAPTLEESSFSIPVKLYSPLREDITVKLVQDDALLDSHYKESRFGFTPFPEGVMEMGSVVIPAGKTEATIPLSLRDKGKLTNEGEHLAALSLSLEGSDTKSVRVFGVQYHFVKAVQKLSDNIAELSINKKEIALTANNPKGSAVIENGDIRFTITTSVAQERKVRLKLIQEPLLLKYAYKGVQEELLPLPEGVLRDKIVEIPAGETVVEVSLPFTHADRLIDAPGYLTAFLLKEVAEDRKYVSATDSYFFVKVNQTTSVDISRRNSWGSYPLEKSGIKAYANGSDRLLPALLDGNNNGAFFEITKSNGGSLELMFESSENLRDLTLYTNLKKSGINSFYVAVTKDKGASWLPRGMVKTVNAENSFNIGFEPNAQVDGVRIYGLKGKGTGLNVYEVNCYKSW